MRTLPIGKKMTNASDARTPCAMETFCRLLMKDCDGPPCPLPNPPSLLLPLPSLFDPFGPYPPPGPYCAETAVAAMRS